MGWGKQCLLDYKLQIIQNSCRNFNRSSISFRARLVLKNSEPARTYYVTVRES